jgi:5-methylcytosine-specific restriction protein A
VDPNARHRQRIMAAACTDHIIPHKGDQALFWDTNNHQSLCKDCHDYKTATEDGAFGRASNTPTR